ncbi:hypothetical protein [Clostridium chromiireducens]|uniref:Uncharacterized protein n=1 Tax=Clostridium chromiireducens TaxID=225345 RepID=A0A1V4IE42_9CLOT|nr:hypothetical protein [Clostridium chromiireducens]MVX65816.1 hypothetical protein [Clostridium chromiireducens]OPJ57925.1 hypothetical protein CLCHR_41710 [Clostridium chromiireducens]RII34486.1 hypothetical protein D2A34_15210 [Clostridium chromiireducens]
MNPYQLIIMVQQRMQQDPEFANKFNKVVLELNKVPGLQQKVIQIAQIGDENQRQQAMDKLPKDAKHAVKKILGLLEEYNINF